MNRTHQLYILLCLWFLTLGKGVFACELSASEHLDSLDTMLRNGKILTGQGKYQEAYANLSAANERFCFAASDDSAFVKLQLETGLAAYLSGEIETSLTYYKKALEVCQNNLTISKDDYINTCLRIGIAHRELGDFYLALDYLEGALALSYEGEGNDLNIGKCQSALGNVNIRLGNYEDALENFREAKIRLSPRFGEDHPHIAALVGNMGIALLELDSIHEALLAQENALAIRKVRLPPTHATLGMNHGHLGDIYLRLDDLDQAEKQYLTAQKIWMASLGPYHINQATAHYKLGDVSLARGDVPGALDHYQEALRIIDPRQNPRSWQEEMTGFEPSSYLELLEVLSRKAKAIGMLEGEDRQLAMEVYQQLDQVILEMRKGFQREASGRELVALSMGKYEAAVSLGLELASGPNGMDWSWRALGFAESAKGVVMDAALNSHEALRQTTLVSSLIQKEKTIRTRIQDIHLKLVEARDTGTAPENLVKELAAAKQAYTVLVDSFKTNYPEYYDLRHRGHEVSPREWVDQIEPGSLVLSYFVGEDSVYGFRIYDHNILGQSLGSTGELERTLTPLINGIQERKQVKTQAEAFSRSFLTPLLTGIPLGGVKRLVIFRDGLISYLPFDFLPFEADGRRMVLEIAPVSYGYTLRSYFRGKASVQSTGTYMAYAKGFEGGSKGYAALPYALEEVEMAQDLLGGTRLVEGEATESSFKDLAGGGQVIHLATHAILDDREPLFSHLVLGEDSINDGLLCGYEVLDLDLNADLAILSACNTGSGKYLRGDGMMSLSKAFAYAGCPAILMNHWAASDRENAVLVNDFLANLAEGMAKDSALQAAKLSYLENADEVKSHPYFWAGLGLVGDTAPVDIGHANEFPYFLAIAIVALLIFAWIAMRIRNRKQPKP